MAPLTLHPPKTRRFRMTAISWPVLIEAALAGSGMRRLTVEVLGLSRVACRTRIGCRFPEGQFVTLRLPTLSPLGARAAWSDGAFAEFTFVSALGASTLELLVDRHRRDGGVRF